MLSNMIVGSFLLFKARFFIFIVWLMIALLFVGLIGGQFSGRQPATVALDLGISFLKITLPILAILMVQELFSKEFERRLYLYSLSYPVSRFSFLIGRMLVVSIFILLILIACGFLLAVLVGMIGSSYEQARPVDTGLYYSLTLIFISVDLFSVISVAVLIAVVAKTPSFVLVGTMGYVFISRSYSSVVALLGEGGELVSNADQYQSSLNNLKYILPDLSSLDIREIALYGSIEFLPDDWLTSLTVCIVYSLAILVFSLWLFQRKRLN